MPNIECFLLAPYNIKQMFHLVNDVSSYTKFLPGCCLSTILKKSNNELIAEMHITTNGIVISLITHNYFIENKSIIILLIKGPFKSFYGHWNFIPVTTTITKITYISYYEFKSIFIEKLFQNIFQEKYKNIMNSFISRANTIYGHKKLFVKKN
ncbi:type II toxin-antitoxin system RatA family toxin [Candidatus Blochmannia ocreatus (nom. nud.)]|uniref:Type II toxin-antitoxin system RatA family toxin n=1 Tax=Candidatus Blochmannia ocreatus (nom. nud.) TaxID=251538 RepID=A0ABY4SSR4_9ENTR|nr:type II toxin-antitoxin system RatA family toxin [Candidatus Blochmannia ocreatus]URJ25026.1 type II toxin-antitoxin system RatA family toxin [Candidatus Blochmannia ocreatus]